MEATEVVRLVWTLYTSKYGLHDNSQEEAAQGFFL